LTFSGRFLFPDKKPKRKPNPMRCADLFTKLLDLPHVLVVGALDPATPTIISLLRSLTMKGRSATGGAGAVRSSQFIPQRQDLRGRLCRSLVAACFSLAKRKCRCCPDGGIHVEYLPWLHGRFTRRLPQQVNRLTRRYHEYRSWLVSRPG